MKKRIQPTLVFSLILLTGFTFFLSGKLNAQHYPFPQHVKYHKHIKPSQYTQEELDDHVRSFYNTWKSIYLKNGCERDQYYVFFDEDNTVTVSEAMGYGMMILPMMAGHDPGAKTYFDGLFRYYKAHPSGLTPNLMAWKQITGCVNADGDDSASDGDIDIAFGLLLAHEQWGSTGDINYLYEAKLIIKDLMGSTAKDGDINQDLHTVKLGDWVTSGNYINSTRTSDFITDHFRLFACISDDSLAWANVVTKCYDLVTDMQENYSEQTGLLPDFIENINDSPKPAKPGFLEGDLDGHYSYNACRDPWRLGFDYLVNGDERALNAVKKINTWLYSKTGGDPSKIYAGYYLNGKAAADWHDVSFTAPFAVGAMLDTTKQEWLNNLYDNILNSETSENGYYGNTLKLLSMIVISGNFRNPSCELYSAIRKTDAGSDLFKIYPTKTKGRVTVEPSGNINSYANINVEVFNLTGSVISERKINNTGKTILNLSDLPSGLYLISILSNGRRPVTTKKVILSKW
jgi:endo-1,4-beta-D-glucanase Y